jgi:uncharacterized membrane protein
MKRFVRKWQDTVIVLMWVLSIGFALINYNKLPEQMPTHFNWQGEADRYADKGSHIALLGSLSLILPLVMSVVRAVDPKKQNYPKFENAFGMVGSRQL